MGVMPVRPLLLQMSCPIMLSMLVQALYNLVDSIFVSRLSESAFLALSLAFPVQSFMIAICVGTGVGINAMLSRRLGQGELEKAQNIALNGYFLYLLSWLAFCLFGLLFARSFLSLYSQDDGILALGTQYLSIVCCASVGMCMQFAAERILQATGHPIGNMLVQGVGVVFNLIFDPILIFGYFGFPALGVAGAAIATVGGQWMGMLVGFFLVTHLKEIKLHLSAFRPHLNTILEIYRIGLPAIITQSLVTVMVAGLNKILGLFSDTLVVVLGIYFKLQNFVFMPVFGLNNGMIPILGYNYGARSAKRITGTIRFALIIAVSIMCLGTLLFQLFPQLLLGFFQPSPAALQAGVPALRLISIAFPAAAVSIICSAVFQALGSPMLSLLVSLLRQLVLVLPAAWLLGLWRPELIWLALPIAEGGAAFMALLLYRQAYQVKILPLTSPA